MPNTTLNIFPISQNIYELNTTTPFDNNTKLYVCIGFPSLINCLRICAGILISFFQLAFYKWQHGLFRASDSSYPILRYSLPSLRIIFLRTRHTHHMNITQQSLDGRDTNNNNKYAIPKQQFDRDLTHLTISVNNGYVHINIQFSLEITK